MGLVIEGLDRPAEVLPPGEGRAGSSLHRLRLGGQRLFVLRQRGRFADIAWDHGRLLAPEIETGAFPEIVATIARSVHTPGNDRLTRIAEAVYRCYSDRLLESVSNEFRTAAGALADGYSAGVDHPRFDRRAVLDALVAIEVDNLACGLTRLLQLSGFVKAATIAGLLPMIGPYLDNVEDFGYLERAASDGDEGREMVRAFSRVASDANRVTFACTGFSLPATLCRDRRHLHARNLDADLYAWRTAPVIALIDETPANAAWHRYVAFGTAGLIYPGGISGLNDAGIAVSLHQMSTTAYSTTGSDIAPFVQQRILREAGSLDEAVEVVRASDHFAAWTIFCSEARTGKAVRIEFSADRVRVSRSLAEPLAQTNHFLDLDLFERHFDADDAHFTPTFGKYLETRARFLALKEKLETGRPHRAFDVDWAIDQLAASDDGMLRLWLRQTGRQFEGLADDRAFGRVARKVYGQMSSIVVVDPDRDRRDDEAWMTIGDRRPACHSHYTGWRIDWNALQLKPVTDRPVRRVLRYAGFGREQWERSLQLYVDARLAVERPLDPAGQPLRRQPDRTQQATNQARAEAALTEAIDAAAADRIVEVPFLFMRARLRHALARYTDADTDWTVLRDIWAAQTGAPRLGVAWPVDAPISGPALHAYDAALVLILSTVTADAGTGGIFWPDRAERLDQAATLLHRLRVDLFGLRPPHFDLTGWLERIDRLRDGALADDALPAPNFVTVE